MSNQSKTMRERLANELKAQGWIRTPAVEDAFRAVPRHIFLPDVPVEEVYTDRSFPTKHRDGRPISSSSQPAIMAVMLEQLGLEAGHAVLEIGAGTGYNAALIARIVGHKGSVVTVDIDEDIVCSAREHLARAGFENVTVICQDGGFGHLASAPYDRIILTVGAWDIAPAWVQQLSERGRLVLPLSIRRDQKSIAFERRGEHLESVSVSDCGFMRLRGAFAGPERIVPLGPRPGPYLSLADDRVVDTEALTRHLRRAAREVSTGLQLDLENDYGSLSLWLALEDNDNCLLGILGEPSAVESSGVPLLIEYSTGDKKERATLALLGEGSLAALGRPAVNNADAEAAVPIYIVSLGSDSSLVKRMQDHLRRWEGVGRPKTSSIHVQAYPKPHPDLRRMGGSIVDKKWTTVVISWPKLAAR